MTQVKKRILWLLLLTGMLAVSGCVARSDRAWLNAEGWRRATLVGMTALTTNVSFDLDEDGNTYFLLLDALEEGFVPHIVALDRQAVPIADVVVDYTLETRPRHFNIYHSREGIELMWILNNALYHMALDADYRGQVRKLSGNARVDSYSTTFDTHGDLVVWYGGNRNLPGVYMLAAADAPAGPILVDANGYAPKIAFTPDGALHASWLQSSADNTRKTIFYRSYPGGEFDQGAAEPVYMVRSALTALVEGPIMGLDNRGVYFFWVITEQSGHRAGTSTAFYIYRPYGGTGVPVQANSMIAPAEIDLPYQAARTEALVTGDRVYLGEYAGRLTSSLSDLSLTQGGGDEIAAAFRLRLPHLRHQDRVQTGVIYLNDGQASSYQLLTFSTANAISPQIKVDGEGQLYVTWLEAGDGGFRAFFASTAPDIRSALNKITVNELLEMLAEVSFGMMSGILLIYYPMMWIILPGLIMLLTTKIRRPDEPLLSLGTLASLLLALVGYWSSKVFFLPDVLTYTPMSAWLPMIPETWTLPLRVLLPLLISIVAFWVAYRGTYAVRRNSPFFLLLIFMGVDGILTMAFYGVVFYGVV